MDRRLTPATDVVAHIALKGRLERPRFTKGTRMEIAPPIADVLDAPNGNRDRQVLSGNPFCVIDQRGGHSFGFAEKDGYCGWLRDADLIPARRKTHRVVSIGTHLYSQPKVQSLCLAPLFLGAQACVTDVDGRWARVEGGFIPAHHLQDLATPLSDPAQVAQMFLGSPYLWGGNSRAGIDCSGLVQAALDACGHACPGDSDLQQALGQDIPMGTALQRGDLLFWKGHVAMICAENLLVHANAHAMAVTLEPTDACIARIKVHGGGDITARRRFL